MLTRLLIHWVMVVAIIAIGERAAGAAPPAQGCWSSACGSTIAVAANLVSPQHVAVDGSSHVFVNDGGIRIIRFDTQGRCELSWLLRPRSPQPDVTPSGLVVAPDGRLLIADQAYGRVRIFSSAGDSLGFFVLNAPPIQPFGMALDRDGNLVITDEASPTVVRYTTDGTMIQQWSVASTGMPFAGALHGVAVDDSNFVYLVDRPDKKVFKYTLGGALVTSWGGPGTGTGQFGEVGQIVADHTGHIVVSDDGNSRIEVFDSSGNYLEEWGAPGSGDSEFSSPYGLAVDAFNNLYIADEFNNRICKYGPGPVPASRTSWGTLKMRYH